MTRKALLSLLLVLIANHVRQASAQPDASTGAITIATLRSMPQSYLLSLYQSSPSASISAGAIRGHLLAATGTRLAAPLGAGGRAIWQGKVFECDGTAINRFFGARVVRGQLAIGPSWYDGAPALILDYEHTSRIYRNYRDEIREVAPGVYLGLMYDRTVCPPKLVRVFALER